MPGDWYPPALHTHLAAEIKAFVNAKGYKVPIAAAGKLSDPDDAERALAEEKMDFVAIARGLLADPDWVKKVHKGEVERLIRCDYCNVCKQLDAHHKKVICFLWPKGEMQAPADNPAAEAPTWGTDKGGLTATVDAGSALLTWSKAEGAARYDIYRADDNGNVHVEDAVKVTYWSDNSILGGISYRYYVRACADTGQASPPSNSVIVEPARPQTQQHGEFTSAEKGRC